MGQPKNKHEKVVHVQNLLLKSAVVCRWMRVRRLSNEMIRAIEISGRMMYQHDNVHFLLIRLNVADDLTFTPVKQTTIIKIRPKEFGCVTRLLAAVSSLTRR